MDKDIKKIIKEINTISLGENDFLAICCDEDDLICLKAVFDNFLDGKFAEKILLHTDNIKLTKITKEGE